jgi:hypothetical protein
MSLDTPETCRGWRNILRISCESSWFFFTQLYRDARPTKQKKKFGGSISKGRPSLAVLLIGNLRSALFHSTAQHCCHYLNILFLTSDKSSFFCAIVNARIRPQLMVNWEVDCQNWNFFFFSSVYQTNARMIPRLAYNSLLTSPFQLTIISHPIIWRHRVDLTTAFIQLFKYINKTLTLVYFLNN